MRLKKRLFVALLCASIGAGPFTVAQAAPAASLAAVDPAILGTCSAAVHDKYVVTGPDGNLYRTWHPQRDPSGCTFAHEHGDDPRTSRANPHMPSYGYVAGLAGLSEPHQGFKTFVINQGASNGEGGTASGSTRLDIHMGTDGAGRFDARYHSGAFDLVSPGGYSAHVLGMFDTGGVGSICADPRQGKTVVTLPGTGCSIQSLYEIWAVRFDVGGPNWPGTRLTVIAAAGVFDPITILNPNDPPGHRVSYQAANYFSGGPFRGCDREMYAGPVYAYNGNGPTNYRTDVYGSLSSSGPLVQLVSASDAVGVRMSTSNPSQMKMRKSQCAAGLGTKN